MHEFDRTQHALGNSKFKDGAQQTLRTDAYKVIVDPARGGLIQQITWTEAGRHIELLHCPPARSQAQNGIDLFGCWPLVPFANRCFEGKLFGADGSWMLPINEPSSGNSMHGNGWQHAWNAEDATVDKITLSHETKSGFGPYRYRCDMEVAIDDDAVTVGLTVGNLGDETLPFGLGLHPWFPCDERTTFCIGDAKGKVEFRPGYDPVSMVPVDADSDFLTPDLVWQESEIALNYVAWNGNATIDYPQSHTLKVTASPSLNMPVLWRPVAAPFMCFEPQSHVIGAPGRRAGQDISPMKMLAPTEQFSGWMRLCAIDNQT